MRLLALALAKRDSVSFHAGLRQVCEPSSSARDSQGGQWNPCLASLSPVRRTVAGPIAIEETAWRGRATTVPPRTSLVAVLAASYAVRA